VSVALRRARPDDVDFLVALVNDPDVEPFLGAQASRDRAGVLEQIARSEREPDAYGRFAIEVDGELAGTVAFERTNERNAIARLGGLALAPAHRGRGTAQEAARLLARHVLLELGFHRLDLEVYGFNERAQRSFEAAGFVREGVKRRAYRRHDEWVDGVLYALVREDLEP
jgi:RimJ/RimL family protein N-acetyltransferase